MGDHLFHLFSLIGSPARFTARVLLLFRYVENTAWIHQPWPESEYAKARFGRHYRWMVWMLFDIKELARNESLLNHGSDADVMHYRQSQLDAFSMVAIVASLGRTTCSDCAFCCS